MLHEPTFFGRKLEGERLGSTPRFTTQCVSLETSKPSLLHSPHKNSTALTPLPTHVEDQMWQGSLNFIGVWHLIIVITNLRNRACQIRVWITLLWLNVDLQPPYFKYQFWSYRKIGQVVQKIPIYPHSCMQVLLAISSIGVAPLLQLTNCIYTLKMPELPTKILPLLQDSI